MSKILILGFKNAGLFRKHKQTKDKIFSISSIRDRKDEPEFEEPITYYQISNVLHVLFGERPTSSVRESLYSKNEYLFEKAKNSFLRIDSFVNDKGKFQTETKHLNKPFWNSWNPQSFMNWERTRKILGEELFEKFSSTLEKVFGVKISEVTFNNVKEKILLTKDDRLENMFKELIDNGKKSFYNSFFGSGTELSDINKNSRTMLTIVRGVDKIAKLEGQILVPVSDEDLEKLRNNKGTATILDGGLVYIKDVVDSNFINPERMGFTKLIDIKTTKN